jgi:hypothetical protein
MSGEAPEAVLMTIDLTIELAHQPGTLATACDVLAHAGINIEGGFGAVVDGRPKLHVLVADAERATRALIDGGFDILAQRPVVSVPIENRLGAAATLLRRITDAGVSVDLVYTALDGRIVLGSDDMAGLRAVVE